MDRANAVSNQPLQQYTDPLVSGFTPQQQQGFQTVQNIQGGYVPFLNAAAKEYGQGTQPIWSTLPSYDVAGLPQGGLDRIGQSGDFATKAGNTDIAGGVSPYAEGAAGVAHALPGQVGRFADQASGIAGSLSGQVGGYANQATTAAGSTLGNIGAYESPYTKNVTDAVRGLFNQQNAEQLAQQRGSTVGAESFWRRPTSSLGSASG